MVQYHGAEAAQRFILTVMNMVYNMFQHHSLGIKVNIQVTKLVLLRQRPAKLSIGHHGERSLESFCHWQNEEYGGARYLGNNQVPGGKDDTPPVDAAVFVTRTDFCVHKDEPCDTVGIAYLGGVCSAKRKCVLAEDNGLNLAFTIAHELGHNLGMNHDDDHSSCAGRSHIMSGEWVKGRNPSDLSWSSCSRDDLENFLKSKVSTCLLVTDPRSQHAVRLPHKLPGMHYSANEQCQILFGTNATFCRNMEVSGPGAGLGGLWLPLGDTGTHTRRTHACKGAHAYIHVHAHTHIHGHTHTSTLCSLTHTHPHPARKEWAADHAQVYRLPREMRNPKGKAGDQVFYFPSSASFCWTGTMRGRQVMTVSATKHISSKYKYM
ncbi:ADAM metallopeptidase with thrombospondin type 1 motif 17 [Phyllostomus discolor]|uniref:ADAM metallopeptidase with thrombospondin type 1 motif 17 n=1 Tax=Phyllostomus discolor TaxID=89673 RepID=A0A834DDF6_9CHIR|nr:ADAM metallopeptidase with thrombospondin type 1 motif 17 [Phyllostomus discolor]